MLRNIPEDRTYDLHRGGSLKSTPQNAVRARRRVEVFFLTFALDDSGLLKPHFVRLTSGAHSTGVWGAPGPIWTSAENLAPAGIGYNDLPTRGELLYRLRYPGPCRTGRR